MTTPRPTGAVDLILTFGDPHPSGRPDPEVPFRMLIMGDFSGKETRQDRIEHRPAANRRPIRVDRDNIQNLLGTLNVALYSPLLGDSAPAIALKFTGLDDFHPDRLVHRVEPLRKLSDLRRRLANQATFPQAADEIHSWAQPRHPTQAQSGTPELSPTRQAPAASLTNCSNRLPRQCLTFDPQNGSHFSSLSSAPMLFQKNTHRHKNYPLKLMQP